MQCNTSSKRIKSVQQNIPLKFILQVVCIFFFLISFAGMAYGWFHILEFMNQSPHMQTFCKWLLI